MEPRENTKKIITQTEVELDRQAWIPDAPRNLLTPAELIEMRKSSPGRFKSPMQKTDLLAMEVERSILGVVETPSFVPPAFSYPIPPQWQAIIDYLYGQGALTQPYISM